MIDDMLDIIDDTFDELDSKNKINRRTRIAIVVVAFIVTFIALYSLIFALILYRVSINNNSSIITYSI